MPTPDQNADAGLQAALELYGEFLRHTSARAPGAFDVLCAEHPALAEPLRQLYGIGSLAQSLAGSVPFHHSLLEVFGEEVEVKLTLDDDKLAAEDEQATMVDATAPPSSKPASGGPAADRYALQGEVARGGMGIIYKVRDRELNRTLAMKVMLGGSPASSLSHPMGEGRGEGSPPVAQTRHPLLSRFLEEVQVTAQLDHPGIVAVHELGLDAAGQPYFTMKLVKGRDLSRIFELARAGEGWDASGARPVPGRSDLEPLEPLRIPATHTLSKVLRTGTVRAPKSSQPQQEGWNLPRAVGALIKACQAVAFAHTKGVIHRDLKPANIMVGRFGEVYVMDWGLAKVTGRKDLHDIRVARDSRITITEIQTPRAAGGSTTADSPLITMDGSVVGTPAYMPPEQARGQVEQVDALSDVYSLGAILYNLLTGQAPYVEPDAHISPHTILARALDGPPKRIHTLNPKAPAELVAICEKAMAREKRERYLSSLDLAEDLQAYLDNRVVKAFRTGAVAEFKSWIRRNKGTASVVGAAALLLVLGSAAFIIQQKKANERLRLNSYVAEVNVASHELNENNLARAVDLLERQIPRHGERDLRGFEWRYLWQRSRGNQLHSFPGHTKYVSSLTFSPDGRLLASASWDNRVQVVDVVSKQVIATLTNITTGEGWIQRYALAFSPDGKVLAVHSGYGVRLYHTTTWSEFKMLTDTQPNTGGVYTKPFAFSPDGRTLAALGEGASVERKTSGRRIVFWDTSTWAVRPLNIQTNLENFGCLIAYSPDGKILATASTRSTPDGSGQVQFWEAGTGKLLGTSPVSSPLSIAFSRNGRWLGIGEESGQLWLWDAATFERRPEPIKADSSHLWSLVFSADSQRLITAGIDQVVRVWDLATLKQTRLLQGHTSEIWALALSHDGRLLAGGTKDGQVLLWNAEAEIEEPGFADELEPLAFSSDSHNILTRGTNFTFTWFDLSTKKPVSSPTLPITSTSAELKTVSPDGSLAAIKMSSDQLEIWDLPRAKRVATLTNDIASFRDRVRFSENNQFLVTECTWPGSEQAGSQFPRSTAEVWQVAAGRHLGSFTNLYPHAISADGRMIAGETLGYHLKLVNVRVKSEVKLPVGHKVHTTASAFSPDSNLLATSSYDGDARLWDIQTRQLVHRMFGHKQGVLTVAFSPDGRTLVSGSNKGDVKFWSVATGKELLSVRLPTEESIDRAKFSPDGRTLVLQNTRHILRVPSLAEIDAAKAAKR